MGTMSTAGADRAKSAAPARTLPARPGRSAAPALPARPAAAAVLRLQRAYGNQAVQRLLPPAASAGTGGGPRVQRWHDAEHDSSTQQGLTQAAGAAQKLVAMFGGPHGANDPRYDTPQKVSARLGDASVNMDRFVPQVTEGPERESHNVGRLPTLAMFGSSMVTSAVGRGATQLGRGLGSLFGSKPPAYQVGDPLPPRGILGEGPDHAESGYYKQKESQTIPQNVAREDYYITEALKAYDGGGKNGIDDALNRLGDAAHVSADRGSHGEGAEGKGHDTPYPPQGREGQTLMPYYMDGWEDNDSLQFNGGAAYQYGIARTKEMFQRFAAQAGTRGDPPAQLPAQDQDPGQGHQGGDQG